MATATVERGVVKKLKDITECSICLKTFTDPRMLPCIHTFCLKCLKDIGSNSQKKPGDGIPCPICRKEFIIPMEGFEKIQKNFFMENLMEIEKTTDFSTTEKGISCDVCLEIKTKVSTATMYCIDCQENFCDDCSKLHKAQKATRNHRIVDIEGKVVPKRILKPLFCDKHPAKPLDYYCFNCQKVICVSCFVESHNSHKCSDVDQVSEEFSKSIKENVIDEIPTCLTMTLTKTEELKRKREEFLKELEESESKIQKRNKELKDMIDRHTKFLLEDLLTIKQRRLKEMEIDKEELERHLSMLESFNGYCKELTSKGSPGDICRSFEEIKRRGKEILDESGTLYCRCFPCVKISFEKTDLEEFLKKNNENAVGRIKAVEQENSFLVVGIDEGETITKDIVKISLDHSNEVSYLEPIPTQMQMAAAAAVYNNTLFVTGIGENNNEIWKYELNSKWSQCTSLVESRRRHCATFIQDNLFISGGFVDSDERTLSSVEAYNALTNRCQTVGQLIHPVYCAASAACGNSIYVFGGADKDDKDVDYVQVYNTLENNCSLLSKAMPRPCRRMITTLWKKSVILLSYGTCFIFNFETEIWEEREQFKTDVFYFGSVLQNEKIFVVGGGTYGSDEDGESSWKGRDDVRYIPVMNIIKNKPTEWQSHAKLPKPNIVHAHVVMTFPGESFKRHSIHRF